MNLDFSTFHPACQLQFVESPEGIMVICPDHRIAANLEAVSCKVSPGDACLTDPKQRKRIGKMSIGVPYQGVKE